MDVKWFGRIVNGTDCRFTYRFQEDADPNLFATEIRNCAGSKVALNVWSAKVILVIASGYHVFV